MAGKDFSPSSPERFDQKHARCGGVILAETPFKEDEDCPICAEIRASFETTGNNRATAGTLLASELGLRVFSGAPGFDPGVRGAF